MPLSLVETRQLVRAWLLADEAINARTVGAVYGAHLASPDAGTLLGSNPLLIADVGGGQGRYGREFAQLQVEIYGYARSSPDAAAELYDLAYLRLHGARMVLAGIDTSASAREVERPSTGRNEELAAYYARGRFVLSVVGGPA